MRSEDRARGRRTGLLAPAQRQGAFKYTEHTEHTEHAPHIAEHTERRAQSAPEHGAAQSTDQSEEESTRNTELAPRSCILARALVGRGRG